MDPCLPMLGAADEATPHIERAFETLLDTLDVHFAVMP